MNRGPVQLQCQTPPGHDDARAIAEVLCRQAATSARLVAASSWILQPGSRRGSDDGSSRRLGEIEDEMFVEWLSYSLKLLELRLTGKARGEKTMARVRYECSVLVESINRRRRDRRRQLKAPAAFDDSRYVQLYHSQDQHRRASGVDREIFERFCECTGLGSDLLVGSGENLAALVLYIALHAVLSAHTTPTREQTAALLKSARECRENLQRVVAG